MSFFRNSTTITPVVFFSPKIAELSYTVLEKTNYIFGYLKKTGDKVNNSRKIYTCPTLIDDNQLFSGDKEKREQIYGTLINKLMIYLALKKHAKVETIIIPTGTINNINNTINEITYTNVIDS